VAVVEIENIDGEEHHHGEPETLLLRFLRQGPRMLAQAAPRAETNAAW
jgi:hypothetical protein